MNPFLLIVIVSAAILILVAIPLVIFSVKEDIRQKHRIFVRDNSVFLNKLYSINRRYSFRDVKPIKVTHSYDNVDFYNDISEEDYLIYYLKYNADFVMEDIANEASNKMLYAKYLDEIKRSGPKHLYSVPTDGYDVAVLNEIEDDLIKTNIRRHHKYGISVTLKRTDLPGHVFDVKSDSFDVEQILSYIERLEDKSGSFYNDREIWDSICRVERGMVSNKLRFEIMRRDGYRCRHCGAFQDGARLEIDHIIPISKGGLSTPDNLQTLCHRCNEKKGSDIDF